MTFTFDLISDLHVETWNKFDWSGQATSPYCVVAGDIARDSRVVIDTLKNLSKCYQAVFYIDGNDEHRYHLDNIGNNIKHLEQATKGIDNIVYMHDNVVVINGVAILATNGWWTYDLDLNIDMDQCVAWFKDQYKVSDGVAASITDIAYHDAAYLMNSVRKLQTHKDVQAIVVVTHTVPGAWIIEHDIELDGSYRFNTTGNPHLELALEEDTENKIRAWCFGHYHQPVDRYKNGIRYVNNCKGRNGTDWCQTVYYPKRITIEY
jgi:predicted phosphodiesterase